MAMGEAQHRQPDHTRGDANTLGGYAAVHDRPPAFEGCDGFSYSVEVLAEPVEGTPESWGGYLLFVQWSRIGASSPMGHLETDFLVQERSEHDAVAAVGRMRLSEVTETLNRLITARAGGTSVRRWWDAMRAEEHG